MKDLVKMFPDATRHGRKKYKADNTPNDPEYGRYVRRDVVVIAGIMLLCVIGIAVFTWLGQKYSW